MQVLSDRQFDEIHGCLSTLRSELGAQCVLLADLSGQIACDVGITDDLDTGTFMPLIADGFGATSRMAQHLRDKKASSLILYEGKNHDIYSTSVGDNLFLTLVFDRRKQTGRIGIVWLYAKRTIQDLLKILSTIERVAEREVEAEEAEVAPLEVVEEKPEDAKRTKVIESATTKLAESGEEPETTGEVESEDLTLNIDEAVKKGLIDEDFAQLLRDED